MQNKHINDISIGEDQWIEYVDFSKSGAANAYPIDAILIQNEKFWNLLEENCVAGCCGINAFVFWPEDIKRIASEFDAKQLGNQFSEILNSIETLDHEFFVSKRLNLFCHKIVLLQLLEHIKKSIEEL
jgi:Family of unknown function (DUF6331)